MQMALAVMVRVAPELFAYVHVYPAVSARPRIIGVVDVAASMLHPPPVKTSPALQVAATLLVLPLVTVVESVRCVTVGTNATVPVAAGSVWV